MSLLGPAQSQKEDEWQELMDHIADFADRWGYDEAEVTEILTRDFKDLKGEKNEK